MGSYILTIVGFRRLQQHLKQYLQQQIKYFSAKAMTRSESIVGKCHPNRNVLNYVQKTRLVFFGDIIKELKRRTFYNIDTQQSYSESDSSQFLQKRDTVVLNNIVNIDEWIKIEVLHVQAFRMDMCLS